MSDRVRVVDWSDRELFGNDAVERVLALRAADLHRYFGGTHEWWVRQLRTILPDMVWATMWADEVCKVDSTRDYDTQVEKWRATLADSRRANGDPDDDFLTEEADHDG